MILSDSHTNCFGIESRSNHGKGLLPHSTRPSPTDRRVGIHNFTFEACSDFTRVTARWVARPPDAAFVTRLRDGQLPDRPARQLPDQPTTLWVVPSSTGDPRLRGALSLYWLGTVLSGLEIDVCYTFSIRHPGGDVGFRDVYVRYTFSFRRRSGRPAWRLLTHKRHRASTDSHPTDA